MCDDFSSRSSGKTLKTTLSLLPLFGEKKEPPCSEAHHSHKKGQVAWSFMRSWDHFGLLVKNWSWPSPKSAKNQDLNGVLSTISIREKPKKPKNQRRKRSLMEWLFSFHSKLSSSLFLFDLCCCSSFLFHLASPFILSISFSYQPSKCKKLYFILFYL